MTSGFVKFCAGCPFSRATGVFILRVTTFHIFGLVFDFVDLNPSL